MSDSTIRIGGVPEHFNLPWHLAIEQQQFRRAGLRVAFSDCPGGTGQMTSALDQDDLDIAILLFEGALRRILNGGDYQIVKKYTDTPLIWGIHVAADSEIHSVEQIRGKRYAISRFESGSHLMAIVDAAKRGWPIDELNYVEVGDLAGARSALASGAADVFLWEKFMTQPLVDQGEFRRVGDRIAPWPAFVVAARTEMLESRAHEIRRVLQVVAKTCRDLENDPAASRVIADRYDLDETDVDEWLSYTQWSEDFGIPSDALKRVFTYLEMLDLIDDPDTGYKRAWTRLKG